MSLLLALLLFQVPAETISRTCKSVEGATVYSNAQWVEEAGDVVGIEVAVFPGSQRHALLFIYEGTPFSDPIPLSGKRVGARVRWSSPKGKLFGTINSQEILGTVQVGDGSPERVRLKKVSNLWTCRSKE
jgi:hypothetical protein